MSHLPNDPVRAISFQNITLLLGKAVIYSQISNLARPDAPEYLAELLHALCIDWKTYSSVTKPLADHSPVPNSLDDLVGQLANILLRIVDTHHAPTPIRVTPWQQDYDDLLLLRTRLASEFGSFWLEQLEDDTMDNFPGINTPAETVTSPSLLEYLRRFRSTPFGVPAEFVQNDWVALTEVGGLDHLEVLAAELGHEWSRTVNHDGSSELVLLVRLWRGLMELWYTVSAEAKTRESAELLSCIAKCQRSVSGALIRWSSKGIIRVAFYGPHLSGKTTTLNALIGNSALSALCEFSSLSCSLLADRDLKGSTRCPCRVQHVPRLQTPSLEFFSQHFMIAVECIRQRSVSSVYQAWLAASPAMRPDIGDLPPLPKDAVDVLLRICSPSFDLPARVSGFTAIRTMASTLLHIRRDLH